ncbi:ribosome maturation factor RimM [Marinithermus hydrothermalis]|uniref:Ribosome maturation factor RimM n=1 Tax=Marinithermus hydrothermalis (strain DSM 14884 / JCM 11576 / T1) TaxID=869210 RepID=F2NPH4_MARHT|nr:ribosome maturation factor RimM [Marinithermus hydrothermalis]AEB12255.1 Ribosome maturation factor rimM [Marinithermus hydrothermalis DSM 14884]
MSRILIGRLGKPYALSGGIRFRTEGEVGLLEHLDRVWIEGKGYRSIEGVEEVGGDLILYLAGVTNRTLAEELVGLAVYADEAALPPLEEGVYYYFQLVGRRVFVRGEAFGEVAEVRDTGAQDVLVIRKGLREYLVPLQAPYVEVRADGIHVDPIPGLLEE